MKQITKRVVDGKTVLVPYKNKTIRLECKNQKEAKFVANLPSLRYNVSKDTITARDDQGRDTTVNSVIEFWRAGQYA